MIQELKGKRSIVAAAFVALVVVMLLLAGMPSREMQLISAYLWPATVALMLCTFGMLVRKPSLAGVAGALLACWFFVCTLANGDHYLTFNLRFVCGVSLTFGVGLPLFLLLEGKQRDLWFTVTAACVGIIAALLGAIGTYAGVMDRPIALPGLEGQIGIEAFRLYAYGKHPNEIGCLLNLGLLCLLVLCFKSRKLWFKLLCLAGILPICFSLSLTVSRTAIAIASLALGGSCLVAITGKASWQRWLLGLAAMAVVFAVALYGMMTWIPQQLPSGAPVPVAQEAAAPAALQTPATDPLPEAGTENETTVAPEAAETAAVTPAPQPQAETAAPEAAQAPAIPEPEDRSNHIWQRSFTDGMGTFSARTEIWQAGLEYIRQNPRTLLLGNTDGQVARIPQRLLGRPEYHMHNTYLEVLLLGGIPGLVLYLLVQVSMLWYAAKQFFSAQVPAWRRVLAAAPVAMLLCTMMEIYPSVSGHASDMIMLALTGAVISYGRTGDAAGEGEHTL